MDNNIQCINNYPNTGSAANGPVSDDPAFHQLSNALWLAMTEYQKEPNEMTKEALLQARSALNAYFASHIPDATDTPAYTIYTDMQLGASSLLGDLSGVSSYFKDQTNAPLKASVEQLLGDIKQYDELMYLPPNQRTQAEMDFLAGNIAADLKNIVLNGSGVSDGYLAVLINEITNPITAGGKTLVQLAAAGDIAGIEKAMATLGETGNYGAFYDMVKQASNYEYNET